jgi:hypothetical protein
LCFLLGTRSIFCYRVQTYAVALVGRPDARHRRVLLLLLFAWQRAALEPKVRLWLSLQESISELLVFE